MIVWFIEFVSYFVNFCIKLIIISTYFPFALCYNAFNVPNLYSLAFRLIALIILDSQLLTVSFRPTLLFGLNYLCIE